MDWRPRWRRWPTLSRSWSVSLSTCSARAATPSAHVSASHRGPPPSGGKWHRGSGPLRVATANRLRLTYRRGPGVEARWQPRIAAARGKVRRRRSNATKRHKKSWRYGRTQSQSPGTAAGASPVSEPSLPLGTQGAPGSLDGGARLAPAADLVPPVGTRSARRPSMPRPSTRNLSETTRDLRRDRRSPDGRSRSTRACLHGSYQGRGTPGRDNRHPRRGGGPSPPGTRRGPTLSWSHASGWTRPPS